MHLILSDGLPSRVVRPKGSHRHSFGMGDDHETETPFSGHKGPGPPVLRPISVLRLVALVAVPVGFACGSESDARRNHGGHGRSVNRCHREWRSGQRVGRRCGHGHHRHRGRQRWRTCDDGRRRRGAERLGRRIGRSRRSEWGWRRRRYERGCRLQRQGAVLGLRRREDSARLHDLAQYAAHRPGSCWSTTRNRLVVMATRCTPKIWWAGRSTR